MAGDNGVRLTPEQQKSRRSRSIAIGLILAALVLLFYVVTIVRLDSNIEQRAGETPAASGQTTESP